MADNEQVTIGAAYFVKLYKKANENQSYNCDNCKEVHIMTRERDELKHLLEAKEEQCKACTALCAKTLTCEEFEKERDKLKAVLEIANATNSVQADQLRDALNEVEDMKEKLRQERENKRDDATAKRLADAEKCMEDVWNILEAVEDGALTTDDIKDIIRAYRAAKETK